MKLKRNIFIGVGIFGIILFVALNTFSYFDLFSLCRIKIHSDVVSGNRATIKKALHLLKKSSYTDYSRACRSIDTISENDCMPGDPRVDPAFTSYRPEGCYIKGTKMMYIDPIEENSSQIISKRAQLIAKFAKMSSDFWDHK